MARALMMALAVAGCAPEFKPAYSGEPDCGRHDALHAIERATCDGSIMIACSCDDRNTLKCQYGSWQFAHTSCSAGLGVSTDP